MKTLPLVVVSIVTGSCSGTTAPPPAHPPDAAGLRVECAPSGPDADDDGLSDRCELDLAAAFAPVLRVARGGCNWDTSVVPARLGGEYLFAVQATAPGRVRVAYPAAYYLDCGWTGAKCWLPFVDCDPHVGDSEAVLLDLVRAGDRDRWRVEAIFLSAHCFGPGRDCRWYRGAELARFERMGGSDRGPPVVWVAEGRQANYPSRSACDAGHSSIDTCDRNETEYRYPIRDSRQNIGSRRAPIGSDGCITAREVGSSSSMPAPDVEECFWSAASPFGGWQRRQGTPGVTPYDRYLSEIAGF